MSANSLATTPHSSNTTQTTRRSTNLLLSPAAPSRSTAEFKERSQLAPRHQPWERLIPFQRMQRMDVPKPEVERAAQLAAQAVNNNVRRLLDLHRELLGEDMAGTASDRARSSLESRLRRQQQMRSLLSGLSAFGRAISRTLLGRKTPHTSYNSSVSLDRPLVRALQNRIRRLHYTLSKAPASRKTPSKRAKSSQHS